MTGPDAFEATAVGDLDGDGVTSRFCMSGRVDPETWEMRRNPSTSGV
jgi:hypothetical protein